MMHNTIQGYMSENECKALRNIFSQYNYDGCIGVEIGSFLGRSAKEISTAIPNGVLYCFDLWNDWEVNNAPVFRWQPDLGVICSYTAFKTNTKDCLNIISKQIVGVESIIDWDTPVDFVFLDANHRNPSDREYIDFWIPWIKNGGMLIGHDFYPNDKLKFPDIQTNIEYLENQLSTTVSMLCGSLWYFNL